MWGYICSAEFTSEISYPNISPALAVTYDRSRGFWRRSAFLVALPLARRFGWFWAEIPGHVRERAIGTASGSGKRAAATSRATPARAGRAADPRLHFHAVHRIGACHGGRHGDCCPSKRRRRCGETGDTISAGSVGEHPDATGQIPDTFAFQTEAQRNDALVPLLRSQAISADGRAFILDKTGTMIASSAPDGDPIVESAIAGLMRHTVLGHVRRCDGVPLRSRHNETTLAKHG